tara:strand:- start:72 stop:365 length:294 start_codon:yes stop_codon:yes gene_type:complete
MSTYAIDKYKKALETIANASDQANPIQLRTVAQTALDWEPTTADELNSRYATNADAVREKDQAELAEYDRKLSEAAESTWRDTVLHPNYKSEYDEEE